MLDTVVTDIYTRVVGLIETQYPGLAIVLENQSFDWNSPPDRYVEVDVEFMAGDQVGLSSAARTRYRGALVVVSTCRAGLGTLEDVARLAWLGGEVAYMRVGQAQFEAPKLLSVSAPVGWNSKSVAVPFHVDPT